MKSILLNDLEKIFEFLEWRLSPEEFVKKALIYAIVVGIAIWFVASILLDDFFLSSAIGIIGFVFAIAFAMYFPILKRKQRNALLEKELPMILTSMAIELNLGISFNECLRNASKNGKGIAKKEFQKIFLEIEFAGKSVQQALMNFSKRSDSLIVKRIASQLVNIYEQGGEKEMRGEPLKKLAEELLARQRIELKRFSGKLAVMSLFFITISAIVPAIFQAFIIVGSMVLEIGFSAEQVLLIVCIGFPIMDLLFLIYLRNITPVFLREE